MSENDKRLNKFLEKNFFSKCSSGHVKCSFDNPVKTFSSKSREFFAQCPKMMKKNVSEKNIPPQKVRLLTLKAVLTTVPRNFCQKAENFPPMSENNRNVIFIKKFIFPQSGPLFT